MPEQWSSTSKPIWFYIIFSEPAIWWVHLVRPFFCATSRKKSLTNISKIYWAKYTIFLNERISLYEDCCIIISQGFRGISAPCILTSLARSSGLYLCDRKIRKNPNLFPIWKIRFGLYWFGAGNRTGFSRLAAARSAPLSGHTVAWFTTASSSPVFALIFLWSK